MKDEPRVLDTDLEGAGVPEEPAVYCWWDGETPIWTGAAENLRHQLLEVDLQGGRSPVPPCRGAVREHLTLLGTWPRGAGEVARRAAITDFLHSCTVCCREAELTEQAEGCAEQARQELWEDAGWRARPGEDRWLTCYLDALEEPGLVFVEVPIKGGPGSRIRRIDAVRFPALEIGIRQYATVALQRAFDSANSLEIIEVKVTLNRTVIGQLLVARDLAPTQWSLPASCHVDLVALVTAGDTALEGTSRRSGIRVEVVERDCVAADRSSGR